VALRSPRRRRLRFNIREMLDQILPRHVPKAEELDARRVDDLAAEVEAVAAGAGGGVAALLGDEADVADAEVQARLHRADQAALAHAAVAGQDRALVLQGVAQRV